MAFLPTPPPRGARGFAFAPSRAHANVKFPILFFAGCGLCAPFLRGCQWGFGDGGNCYGAIGRARVDADREGRSWWRRSSLRESRTRERSRCLEPVHSPRFDRWTFPLDGVVPTLRGALCSRWRIGWCSCDDRGGDACIVGSSRPICVWGCWVGNDTHQKGACEGRSLADQDTRSGRCDVGGGSYESQAVRP